MRHRPFACASLLIVALVSFSAAAPSAVPAGVVRLSVRSENSVRPPLVRVHYLEADTLRGAVQELELPVDIEVPGLTIRVRIEPLNRALVTKTTAEFWYGSLPVTRGEVIGVGAEIQVDRGALAIRTAPRSGYLTPLNPQP